MAAPAASSASVTAEMRLDCASLTPEGVSWAKRNGECGYGASPVQVHRAVHSGLPSRAVNPMDTTVGNCGTATLNLTSTSYQRATVDFRAHSSRGPIVHYRLDVFWDSTSGRSGSTFRQGYAATSTISFLHTTDTMGRGALSASMTGVVTTLLGNCSLIPPHEIIYIP